MNTDSWALKAIEREAMNRAIEELSKNTYMMFMGYNKEELARIVIWYKQHKEIQENNNG